MKRLYALGISVIFISGLCKSQNLVPNCGFEEIDTTGDHTFFYNTVARLKKDSAYTSGNTPIDEALYWNKYSLAAHWFGENYAIRGILSASVSIWPDRSYLSTELCRPMRSGETYNISFYLQPIRYSKKVTSNIHVYFSNEPLVITRNNHDSIVVNVSPSAAGPKDTLYEEKMRVYKVDMQYRAKGGERFMALGNFHPNKKTHLKRIKINKDERIRFRVDDIVIAAPADTFNCCQQCLLQSDYFNQRFDTGKVYSLPNLTFAYNDSTLREGCYPELETVRQLLEYFPVWNAHLIGHTDSTGGATHNLKLSVGRARAVKDSLIKAGVRTERIKTIGKGATQPLAPNYSDENRALNRRVEVIFYSE